MSTIYSVKPMDLAHYKLQPLPYTLIERDPIVYWDSSQDHLEDRHECILNQAWQSTFYPTCNNVHETASFATKIQQEEATTLHYITSGSIRDVWQLQHDYDIGRLWAVKTLKLNSEFDQWHVQHQSEDAIISEQLTFSKFVASIYNFCGTSAVYEFATEGTLEDHYQTFHSKQRLAAAAQMTRAVSDLHTLGRSNNNNNKNHHAQVAHADIADVQFLKLGNAFVLNDFNYAFMIYWHKTQQRPCKIKKPQFITWNRSPEEIRDEWNLVDEKVDVYAMGNIYYQLLTNQYKYSSLPESQLVKKILSGKLPAVPSSSNKKKDTFVSKVLQHAMKMSLVLNPNKRASSTQIANYLEEQLHHYNDDDDDDNSQQDDDNDSSSSYYYES